MNICRACGKSSLTIRLTDNTFHETHDVTIAAEIGSKIVPVDDSVFIKLQIWVCLFKSATMCIV